MDEVTPTDLRSFHVFQVTANCGGFTRAQEELGIGQSTISLQVSALEKRLGYRLCERGRGGFRLTQRGHSVLEAYAKLQQATETFADTVSILSERIVGKLRLGLLDHTATDERFSIVTVIRAFKQRAPDVEIEIIQDVQIHLREMIASNRLDLAIGTFSAAQASFDNTTLYTENQFIHCGRQHPLFELDIKDIRKDTLESCHWVQRGYELPPREGFPLDITRAPATAANLEAVATLLQASPLLGYLPSHFAQRFIAAGTLHRLTSAFAIEYDIMLLSQSGRRESAATKLFRKLVVDQASARQTAIGLIDKL